MSLSTILLCKGNEGKQLLLESLLQIRLYQLPRVTCSEIIKEYARIVKPNQQPINLVTKKRNFYIDTLLSKNLELIVTNNEQSQAITIQRLDLPLELEVVFPDPKFIIQSQVDLSFFNLLKKIGEGTFAEIFLAKQKYDQKIVCIKRINKIDFLQKGSKQLLLSQFNALKYRHRHKINLFYMFQSKDFLYFVTEFCPFGDLYTLIKNQNKDHDCEECQKLDKMQKYSIWMQVAFMIVHMHQRGFIYRDLKPQNIIFDERGFAKICDFGYCIKYEKNQTFKSLCGTLEYIAPELANHQAYDKAVDIYGLGILLYELIAIKTPFEGITLDNMAEKKLEPIKFDRKLFTDKEESLILALTKQKPHERIGYQDSKLIFKHPFFDQHQKLVKDIINAVPNYYFLLKLQHQKLLQRQINIHKQGYQHDNFFQRPYNYLTPTIQIQEKIGPKFNSSF